MSRVRDLVLALDGATEYLSLAVATLGGELLTSRTVHLGRGHAARLPAEIQALFDGLGRDPSEVARICVGTGPGSYTGIRVSVSFAYALARAFDASLAGASSLIAVGGPRLGEGDSGVALLDARRGNWYAQALRREATAGPDLAPQVTLLSQPVKLPFEQLASFFEGLPLLPEGPPDASFLCAVAATEAPPAALYM